jgi:hypothetical protein
MSLYSFGAKLANYVDLHNTPEPAKKELPQHEVFNNALTRAEAAGEKPSPELFARIQKEHDDAQKTEKKSKVTGMTFDPDHANVKKLKAQHPNNWRQVMAKSQGLSDSSMAKAIKKAQSACSPCAMPNGPTNKKPYTSESPAVTDASQKSVEIGKPPVTETEHSEAKAKQPEEGAKSAYAFGAKVAAGWEAGPKRVFTPASGFGLPESYAGGVADANANMLTPNSGAGLDGLGKDDVNSGNAAAANYRNQANLNKLQRDVDLTKFLSAGQKPSIMKPGPRNMLDTVIDSTVAAPGKALTFLNNARLSAGKQLGEMYAAGGDDGGRGYQGPPGSTPQASGKVGPKPDVAGAGKGTGAAGGGSSLGGILQMMRNNPGYTAAGGLGALGLGGLLYHLNSQPKKKKRDEEEV